jgi:hypothetical protein
VYAAYPSKSTVSVSEFCHFMEWASALASQEDAEHAVADQVGKDTPLLATRIKLCSSCISTDTSMLDSLLACQYHSSLATDG